MYNYTLKTWNLQKTQSPETGVEAEIIDLLTDWLTYWLITCVVRYISDA